MIEDVARDYHVTAAELIRAIVFERKPISVVPCNSRHKGCTAEHRDLVDSYNDQLNREREELEDSTGMYAGDIELWKENGGTLTTFKRWLISRTS